jgi:hypothetical protein
VENFMGQSSDNKQEISKKLRNINPSMIQRIRIEELALSKNGFNALKRAGLNYIFDVYQLIQNGDLTQIPTIGVMGEKEIVDKLEDFLSGLQTEEQAVTKMIADSEDQDGLLIDKDITNNLPINVLEEELGTDIVNNLIEAKLYTIGDLNNLVTAYLKVVNSQDHLIDAAIGQLIEEVKTMITGSGLNAGVYVYGKPLTNVLYSVPGSKNEKLDKYHLLRTIKQIPSLRDELMLVYDSLSKRETELFLRYTLGKETYRKLGEEFSLSGERIRQIINNASERLCQNLQKQPILFLQSAFNVADNLGEELSEETLMDQLKQIGMLKSIKPKQYHKTFNMLLALIQE